MFIAVSKCFKSTNFIDLWDQIRSNKSAGWKGASGQGPLLPSYSDFDPKCGNCCSPQKKRPTGGTLLILLVEDQPCSEAFTSLAQQNTIQTSSNVLYAVSVVLQL
jgi:hypothetical protein